MTTRVSEPVDRTRRFTADEVLQMVEAGILGEDEPYELLGGELVAVSPQDPPHSFSVVRLTADLLRAYPEDRYSVRPQLPIVAGETSLPEPDLAVCRGRTERFAARHPSADQAVLVIEVVSDRERLRAAERKRLIYAAANAPCLWIVNLHTRTVSVSEDPRPDGAYRRHRLLTDEAELELPELSIQLPVATILPHP